MSRVVLVGAPGAGKSSVGQRIARAWHAPLIDTDRLVESVTGKSVADVFLDEGEAAFRALEATAVAQALADPLAVVSVGGGAILSEHTRALLRDESVVWLRVSVADASKRVGLGASRPLLMGNVRGTLIRLLEERTPLYAEVATWTVDTDGRTLDDVSAEVLSLAGGVHDE